MYKIKTKILHNNILLCDSEIIKTHLNDYEINHILNTLYEENIKQYGNGLYSHIANKLYEQTGIIISEESILKRLKRFNNARH
ncbi:MAG: hypothetical protein GYA62_12900 [Bacteroidales bacterium]|nr:hypothetical protein [Bacteroidales bacterium]